MEETLQHSQTTQCIGLPPTGTRIHHRDGPKASHALTFKLDQSIGADHTPKTSSLVSPISALDVVGDIDYTGTLTDLSDRRLKENIVPLENSLEGLMALQAYSFTMVGDETGAIEYGLMAQDVKPVFPLLVKTKDKALLYLTNP